MNRTTIWQRGPGNYVQWPFPETQRQDNFVVRVEENRNWIREQVTLLAACPTVEAAAAAFRLMNR